MSAIWWISIVGLYFVAMPILSSRFGKFLKRSDQLPAAAGHLTPGEDAR